MKEFRTIKKHWLYGDCKFKVDVREEDSCGKCVHWRVCKRSMEDFCLNYDFGTSEKTTCDGCIHRFTRYINDEERIPCFKCRFFEASLRGEQPK